MTPGGSENLVQIIAEIIIRQETNSRNELPDVMCGADFFGVVDRAGIEPATHGFSGRCSTD